jgi:hypothetical protein
LDDDDDDAIMTPQPTPVDRVILVYNGDSGLAAMLLDALKKVAGREDCALCEITYSPLGKRQEWAACERRLGVAVEELHRDRVPPAWGISPAELPCILGRAGDQRPFVLLSRDDIQACQRCISQLEGRLRDALSERRETPTVNVR